MPADDRNSSRVEYECPECSKATAVNLRTGLVNIHHRPETRETCPESGVMVVEPDGSFDAKIPRTPPNPNAVTIECPQCGRDTWANRRSGLLYSHNKQGSTDLCPASSRTVMAYGGPAPHIEPEHEQTPDQVPPPRVAESPSTSVRAIPTGLPGLGRRRP